MVKAVLIRVYLYGGIADQVCCYIALGATVASVIDTTVAYGMRCAGELITVGDEEARQSPAVQVSAQRRPGSYSDGKPAINVRFRLKISRRTRSPLQLCCRHDKIA